MMRALGRMNAAGIGLALVGCGTTFADPIGSGPVDGAPEASGSEVGADAATKGDAASAGDAGVDAWAPSCATGQWCWANPSPTGEDLVGAFETADGQSAWAVTETGVVLRAAPVIACAANGCGPTPATWKTVYSPLDDRVATDMFGLDDSHVWVSFGRANGATGGLLAWNGSSWASFGEPPISWPPAVSVWAASPNEVWVAFESSVMVFDPASGSIVAGLDGVDAALGSAGLLDPVRQIYGTGPDDVWIVGADGSTLHWNGARPISSQLSDWTRDGTWTAGFEGIWSTGPGDLHMALSSSNPNGSMHLVFVAMTTSGWFPEGQVDAPASCTPLPDAPYATLTGHGRRALVRPAGEAGDLPEAVVVPEQSPCGWSASYGPGGASPYVINAFPFPVRALTRAALPPAASSPVGYDVWAMGPDGQMSRTAAQNFGFQAGQWSSMVQRPRADFEQISVDREGDVWVQAYAPTAGDGEGDIYRLDGSGLTTVAQRGHTLFARSKDDVWVGASSLEHFDGQGWTDSGLDQAIPGASPVQAIWAAGPSDVWVATSTGLAHYDGASWKRVGDSTGRTLGLVSGVDSDDVWFGGTTLPGSGQISHWNGSSLDDRSAGLAGVFVAQLLATGPDEAWAIGWHAVLEAPSIFHYAGGSWQLAPAPPPSTGLAMNAMAALAPNDVWFAGVRDFQETMDSRHGRGGMMHWDGSSFSTPTAEPPGRSLLAVSAGPGGRIWAAGEAGTLVYAAP